MEAPIQEHHQVAYESEAQLITKAEHAYANNDLPTALAYYQQALRTNPSVHTKYNCAYLLKTLGRMRQDFILHFWIQS